jgi:hypothetical protein
VKIEVTDEASAVAAQERTAQRKAAQGRAGELKKAAVSKGDGLIGCRRFVGQQPPYIS